MTKNMCVKNLIFVSAALFVGFLALSTEKAYADCEPNYGGGETCIVNKRFEIDKDVRFEGDSDWEDKVTGAKENDVIEFRVKIKNLSDEEGDIDFDDMKMKDTLPGEMYRVGGSGLTEYWDDFAPGETKTFVIKTKVNASEFDREGKFEKCVVNKAKVYWDGNFEGSDTATVCYGDLELSELPETGFVSTTALAGLGLIAVGLLVKLSKKLS